MSEMTWDDFLQHEEEKEKQRRIKRLAEELKPVTAKPSPKSTTDKKAEQRALKDRIMGDAQKRWEEGSKRRYDLAQPLNVAEPWLVFDRATGELYGEAVAVRAYQAWAEVNPTRLVADPEKPELKFSVAVGFNACRCVLRSEWQAAEVEFREKKKKNGVSHA